MTSIGFAPDIETVDLNDFEFERMCTPVSEECAHKAEWICTLKCCWIEIPYCEQHHQQVVHGYANGLRTRVEVMCRTCGWTGKLDPNMATWRRI